MTDSRSVVADVEREQGDGAPGQPPSPTPYSEVETPSGIGIRYFVEDKDKGIKRHYEIRPPLFTPETAGDTPETEWRTVPSVSTIVDKFKDSGGLIVWAQRMGVKGTQELLRRGLLRPFRIPEGPAQGQIVLVSPDFTELEDGSKGVVEPDELQIYELLTQEGLLTDDEKRKGGDRGQSAHDALELWAKRRTLPDSSFFPDEEKGYIEGLCMFLEALEKCEPEIIATERMVASVKHGFAGRYDLEIRTHKPGKVVKRWMPKRGPQYANLRPGLYVPDLKTSKWVYKESHFPQLEGYEIGRVEGGYKPSVARGVIHVHPGDPKLKAGPNHPFYEFVPSTAKASTFLATLALFNEYREL